MSSWIFKPVISGSVDVKKFAPFEYFKKIDLNLTSWAEDTITASRFTMGMSCFTL